MSELRDSFFKVVKMDKAWPKLSLKIENLEPKVELIQTETAGRGLVASEDLNKNEIIFTERPFVVGPSQTVGPHFCANCSQPLNVGVLQGKQHNFFLSIVASHVKWSASLSIFGKQTLVMTLFLDILCKLALSGKKDNITKACSLFIVFRSHISCHLQLEKWVFFC